MHSPSHRHSYGAQRGIVLIIALIMLVVVSLLATLSIRNAVSGEAVSGNVRTTQLASQAAEVALRYCENAVVAIAAGSPPASAPTILPNPLTLAAPSRGTNPAYWDVVTTDVFVVPAAEVNQTGSTTFQRAPECMVERVPVVNSAGVLANTTTYQITARGFGPEVAAADATRSRPAGSEVWMQSVIEIQ